MKASTFLRTLSPKVKEITIVLVHGNQEYVFQCEKPRKLLNSIFKFEKGITNSEVIEINIDKYIKLSVKIKDPAIIRSYLRYHDMI